MATSTTKTNKPFSPRGNDQSPLAYNRAKLYSGKALDFDGVNDYVTFDGFAGTLSDDDAWTLCGYFKANENSGTSIWFSAHTESVANVIRVGVRENELGLFYDDSHLPDSFIGTEDLNNDEWHFVALSRPQGGAGTEVTLYVNGIASGTLETDITWNVATKFSIGQEWDYNGASDFFDGQITNTKLFNTALTAAQVADLYNNPEKVVPTGVDNTALKLWLPMMEGAGTTAYDGSGNGNHGTISGATYVNGIGAPVAQSAVMDWNKGVNHLKYSENMVTGWTLQNVGASVNALESPDGLTTATKFTATAANTFHINNFTYASAPAGIWKESIFAKKGEVDFAFLVIRVNGGTDRYGVKFDLTDGTFVDDITSGSPTNTGYEITDAGNGWYKCTVQASHTSGNITNVFGPNIAGNLVDINGSHLGDGTSGMYFWGASLHPSTAGDSYVRTEATAQTTPVLLPQGLTTGRDITGVNLFENVRKQGALNLDGNSWAEVHDNESLDITDAITLEAWVKWDASQNNKGILGRYLTSGANRSTMLVHHVLGVLRFYTSADGSSTNFVTNTQTLTDGEWYHIVGTSDGSTNKIYVNAQTPDSDTGSSIIAVDIPLEIGRYNQDPTYSYQQPIAQPRIYNRALTAEEVQRSYDSGKNIYTNS